MLSNNINIETYELILKHDYKLSDGRSIQIDQPLVVSYSIVKDDRSFSPNLENFIIDRMTEMIKEEFLNRASNSEL